jgi:hypothetical protein
MKSQLKKEMTEAAIPVAVVFAGLCCAWIGGKRFDEVLLAPNTAQCLIVVGTAIAAGALIGFFQFAGERWRGTLGFAVHRAGGCASVFATKCVVGLASTLLLAVGPVLAFALWHLVFSVNAPVIQGQRLVEYALYAFSGVTGYATGVLASQLRRAVWFDLTVLVLGAVGMVGLTALPLWFSGGSLVPAIAVYLLIECATAGILLSLALKLMNGARDPSLLFSRGQLGALAGLGIVFILLPATIAMSGLLESLRASKLEQYPEVVQYIGSGEFGLMDRTSRDLVDSEFRVGTQEITPVVPKARVVYSTAWTVRDLRESERTAFPPPPATHHSALVPHWERLTSWGGDENYIAGEHRFSAFGFLDRDAGVVRAFWIERGDRSTLVFDRTAQMAPTLPLQCQFEKPHGRGRFSPSTLRMGRDEKAWCLVDPEDMSVWKIAPTQFKDALSELHLPEGDKLVRLEPFYSREPLRRGMYSRYAQALLFVGERGEYVWRNGQFETYTDKVASDFIRHVPPGEPVPASKAEALVTVRSRLTDFDPIHPRVEIRDASGEHILFAHEYAPQTPGQRATIALLYAGALLRMPIACLYSFVRDIDEASEGKPLVGGIRAQVEPLLSNGRRAWLLLSNFAVSALCTRSLVKRMKRSGADSITISSCAVIVALFGYLAYVYFRGLMPKSAELTSPTLRASAAGELLIQSA